MKKAPNDVDRHVGSRIRLRRTTIGMSQEKLGEAIGITFQQVQKYEKGSNRVSASRLQQISTVLGVAIDYFYSGLEGAATERPAGFGESEQSAYEADGLTADAHKLVRAYYRVADPRLRRKLIEIATVLGDDAPSP